MASQSMLVVSVVSVVATADIAIDIAVTTAVDITSLEYTMY